MFYTPAPSSWAVTYWYPQLTTMLLLLRMLLLVGLQLPGRVLSEPVLFRHVHPLAGGQQDLETEGRGEEAVASDAVQQYVAVPQKAVARDVVPQSVAVPQKAVDAEAAVFGVPGGWHGRYHRVSFSNFAKVRRFVRIRFCETSAEIFLQISTKVKMLISNKAGSYNVRDKLKTHLLQLISFFFTSLQSLCLQK
jgi:hypothetical protein